MHGDEWDSCRYVKKRKAYDVTTRNEWDNAFPIYKHVLVQ